MAPSLSVASPILVVLLFCLTPSSGRPVMKLSSQEITQVCSTSGNPSFCSSFLNSAPGVAGADLLGAGKIALKLAETNATSTLNVIRSLLNSAGGDPKLKARLEDCSELFSDAVSSIQESVGLLTAGDYASVLTYISAALDAGSNCSDGFEGPPAIPPSLVEGVQDLPKICSVVLAITTRLKGQ